MSTNTHGANNPSNGNGPNSNANDEPLFSLRTALLLLAAIVIGSVIGLLTYAASQNVPTAVIAGIGVAGATLYGGHSLLGHG
ncbi:hypothetical protein V5P93_000911 [Actinokineospora auranticolor]|uniref:Uncharacterized protein n=1 Tax=Actinokineospora auranticolor TaxID=155976 RepID=A0A2S6GY96_9PSEU|nr:hypothetical protein [Actinokineospora auranticolor]PPK70212.1 hypothetical protein CLV40_102123 [Actinokineospora auranticolor]